MFLLLTWTLLEGSGLVHLIFVSPAPSTELGTWSLLSKCVLYEQASEDAESSEVKVLNTLFFIFPREKESEGVRAMCKQAHAFVCEGLVVVVVVSHAQ